VNSETEFANILSEFSFNQGKVSFSQAFIFHLAQIIFQSVSSVLAVTVASISQATIFLSLSRIAAGIFISLSSKKTSQSFVESLEFLIK
jgi:hypothetical protein